MRIYFGINANKVYVDRLILALTDIIVPSLYIIWLGFWIIRI